MLVPTVITHRRPSPNVSSFLFRHASLWGICDRYEFDYMVQDTPFLSKLSGKPVIDDLSLRVNDIISIGSIKRYRNTGYTLLMSEDVVFNSDEWFCRRDRLELTGGVAGGKRSRVGVYYEPALPSLYYRRALRFLGVNVEDVVWLNKEPDAWSAFSAASYCSAVVIGFSAMSWWCGWYCQGDVIRPYQSKWDAGFKYPKSWIII